MIGDTISHYQILEKIGSGGMGEVYLARDTKLNRKVALKFLPVQLASDEELKERFKREARAAATLNHPSIITVYEVSEHENRPFIAMEYVEGESLKDLIARKELSLGEVLDVALQVSEGLAVAHQEGIVHRDIKPQNIMMGKDGRVRICDFGLAKAKKDATLTQAGSTLGTIAYVSPEQAQGKEVDQRGDIFSFGVVLYEMVTGQLPFRGEHEAAIIHSIVNDTPEPLARYKSEVPEELQKIVDKAMEKDRGVRYQHADDLQADLRKLRKELESAVTKTLVTKVKPSPSIAVLPFADMSAQKDQEYFCDGMTEELINALTKIEKLQVASRTSAFQFKGRARDIHEIGRKLKVQTVLEGSVRKAGKRLRITAQLVNVADGYHLWSEKYDRDMEDIFAIQDEISLAIVSKLKVKLLGQEKAKLEKRYTDSAEAYNLYLKGRYFWNNRTKEGLQRGLEYFEQAIEQDPTYALAYAGIADCYNMLGFFDHLPPRQAFPKAKEAAEKALKIDETLAEAHTSLAHVRQYYDWDWLAAEKEYKKAIELNPSYATAYQWYAEYLGHMGRHDESIAMGKRALELDPLSPVIGANLAAFFWFARRYDQAIEGCQKVLEIDPDFMTAHWILGLAYAEKEMYDEAVGEIQKAVDLSGGNDSPLLGWLGAIFSRSGKKDQAKKILVDLFEASKRRYVSPAIIALNYLGLGQKDKIFEWLEKAYEERDHWLETLKVHPMLDNVRSDPRYTKLLKKVGLEK